MNGNIIAKEVIDNLEKDNIESRPIWKPMHLQPFFSEYEFIGTGVSEDIFNRGVCLPSGTNISEATLQRVCNVIKGMWSDV